MIAALALMLAAPAAEAGRDWRSVATAGDRIRLREWRSSWRAALARVHGDADQAVVARDPVLFDPDGALDRPVLPVGDYRCRMVKVEGDRLVMDGWTRCRIAGDTDAQTLTRSEGGQRFAGRLFPGDTHRGVFLGSLAYADELRPAGYGRSEGRDMAGFVERIGVTRWRIALPAPRFESSFDLLELTP